MSLKKGTHQGSDLKPANCCHDQYVGLMGWHSVSRIWFSHPHHSNARVDAEPVPHDCQLLHKQLRIDARQAGALASRCTA
jgi:hypothetical protein